MIGGRIVLKHEYPLKAAGLGRISAKLIEVFEDCM